MLAQEEKKARYARMLIRCQRLAKMKRARQDAIWESKPVDRNSIGTELLQK